MLKTLRDLGFGKTASEVAHFKDFFLKQKQKNLAFYLPDKSNDF